MTASGLIAFLAATAVTRFRFRLGTILLIMFPVARTVPVEALAVPLFFVCPPSCGGAGQPNKPGSLILPHVAFSPPFAIRLLRGFVKAVPEALEGPVSIDGRDLGAISSGRFFFFVLVQRRPLSGPGGAAKD